MKWIRFITFCLLSGCSHVDERNQDDDQVFMHVCIGVCLENDRAQSEVNNDDENM